jgi:RHS repeat-associated protein
MTDSSGNMVYRAEFDPYGKLLYEWSSPANLNTRKFTGYERDAATNLDYAQARMYGSDWGRFMTPDPAGMEAVKPARPKTLNRYSYVHGDPVNLVDRSGKFAGTFTCHLWGGSSGFSETSSWSMADYQCFQEIPLIPTGIFDFNISVSLQLPPPQFTDTKFRACITELYPELDPDSIIYALGDKDNGGFFRAKTKDGKSIFVTVDHSYNQSILGSAAFFEPSNQLRQISGATYGFTPSSTYTFTPFGVNQSITVNSGVVYVANDLDKATQGSNLSADEFTKIVSGHEISHGVGLQLGVPDKDSNGVEAGNRLEKCMFGGIVGPSGNTDPNSRPR